MALPDDAERRPIATWDPAVVERVRPGTMEA